MTVGENREAEKRRGPATVLDEYLNLIHCSFLRLWEGVYIR